MAYHQGWHGRPRKGRIFAYMPYGARRRQRLRLACLGLLLTVLLVSTAQLAGYWRDAANARRASEELRALIMQDCMENEDQYLRAHSGDFYPGCMETIERLHEEGYRVYIVSNCQDGYIETLIEDAGWILGPVEVEGDVQDFECYGRTGKKKGSNIRLLMERNGLLKESCVYVGDTAMDEAGAAQAGIRFIYASYGFGTVANPKAVIHEISELPEVLQRLSK